MRLGGLLLGGVLIGSGRGGEGEGGSVGAKLGTLGWCCGILRFG